MALGVKLQFYSTNNRETLNGFKQGSSPLELTF